MNRKCRATPPRSRAGLIDTRGLSTDRPTRREPTTPSDMEPPLDACLNHYFPLPSRVLDASPLLSIACATSVKEQVQAHATPPFGAPVVRAMSIAGRLREAKKSCLGTRSREGDQSRDTVGGDDVEGAALNRQGE